MEIAQATKNSNNNNRRIELQTRKGRIMKPIGESRTTIAASRLRAAALPPYAPPIGLPRIYLGASR
jgi:hypothetical protein